MVSSVISIKEKNQCDKLVGWREILLIAYWAVRLLAITLYLKVARLSTISNVLKLQSSEHFGTQREKIYGFEMFLFLKRGKKGEKEINLLIITVEA